MNFKIIDPCPIVEGKSKKIYKLSNNLNFMVFKPHLRSITYQREGDIEGTEHERLIANINFLKMLELEGIQTQLAHNEIVEIDGMKGIIVKNAIPIPIEFIARFYASGSIVRMFPSLVKPMQKFKEPLYKYDFKQDIKVAGVDDPMLNESYIVGLGLLDEKQLCDSRMMLKLISNKINDLFNSKNIMLIDMKMEFGFDEESGDIILIDEISQDCIRANDKDTGTSITKELYRQLKTEEEVLNGYKKFNEIFNFK